MISFLSSFTFILCIRYYTKMYYETKHFRKVMLFLILLQTKQIIVHAFCILCPVPIIIYIPCKGFSFDVKALADSGKLSASVLDILTFSFLLLTENKDILLVLSVMFTILAFLIVIAFAYRLNQLIHIVCLINKFCTIRFHLL